MGKIMELQCPILCNKKKILLEEYIQYCTNEQWSSYSTVWYGTLIESICTICYTEEWRKPWKAEVWIACYMN
jgi:hypothetical protein